MITRYTPDGEGCFYASLAGTYIGEYTELYAEYVNPTWDDKKEEFGDDDACYEDLKNEIIWQAEDNGLHPSRLKFWYDD